ncbi:hypothetical protein [uncultured Corynebacterium sp.]|uniref:hypothetical protein n=1 Tax=uncultured Corynebacterium sp. TaxID=159447 RepID=UPI0025F57A6E|nr:hypothetical protein [uncultured Corynebacterium sp.]
MKAKYHSDPEGDVSITNVNEHYNFYEQLNLDPSLAPEGLVDICTARLRELEDNGVPETDARVQELLAARTIFRNDRAKATYDDALQRTDIPAMTVPALRHLARTGTLPDEYASTSDSATQGDGSSAHCGEGNAATGQSSEEDLDAQAGYEKNDQSSTTSPSPFSAAPTPIKISVTLIGLMGIIAAIAVVWSRFSDDVRVIQYNPMTGAVMYNHPTFTVNESWAMLTMGAGILIPALLVPQIRRFMRVPVLTYAVTGLMLSAFPYKSVVVGEGDKIVTIITALASVALIALAMMMTTRTRTTPNTSGQDGFTAPDPDGSSFKAETPDAESSMSAQNPAGAKNAADAEITAGAETTAGSRTVSGAEVANQKTSGTSGKQTNE